MISWHDESCYRPDVSLVDGNPFCMSCGFLASPNDLDAGQTPPPSVLPTTPRCCLALSWPSSVTFTDACISGTDGEDIADVVAEVVGGLHGPQDRDVEMSLSDADPDPSTQNSGSLDTDSQGLPQSRAAQKSRELPRSLTGRDAIRILRLSKGKGPAPLHGTLEVHELKYFPEYEALSYTWADATGDASRTKKLYLGREWGVLPVTPNCEAALRCLRLPNKDRHVWVDSICINQDDIEERSHQVQMMNIIYQTAQRVLVYLGDDAPSTDILSTRLRSVRPEWRNEWDGEWTGMDNNLKRPYFFRSWIIQEIAVAKTVLVTDGSAWHVWPIHDGVANTQTILPWIKHFNDRRYKTSDDLIHLIVDSWSSQASDPRDKVFSLLGVISGAAADGLTADYSLSIEQIYTGLAAFALQGRGMSEVLKYAGGYERERSRSLPSWVPDWQALSQDWGIMARIQRFHSKEAWEKVLRGQSISPGRTEGVSWPWPGAPAPPTDTSVHRQTGAICLSGIKITELPPPRPSPFLDAFSVCTSDGLFIAAPITAKPGDMVFFISGLGTPVLLRRQVDGNDSIFAFVGACHVRIQTGINMRDDSWSPSFINLHKYPEFFAIKMPSDWTVRKSGSSDTATEFRKMMRELVNTEFEDYTPIQYQLLERLGREAETTWTAILQESLPIVLFAPAFRSSDIMEPVVPLLDDLKEALKLLCDMWAKVVAQLDQCSQPEGQYQGDLRGQVLAHCLELEKRIEALRLLHILETPDLALVTEKVNLAIRDELADFYSDDGVGITLRTSKSLDKGSSDPNSHCPAWYRLTPYDMGKDWWLSVLRTQTGTAAEHLRNALSGGVLDAQIASGTSSTTSTVLQDSLVEARGWQTTFSDVLGEIDLTKSAVEILIKQRKRYRELTKDGWKRIVIV